MFHVDDGGIVCVTEVIMGGDLVFLALGLVPLGWTAEPCYCCNKESASKTETTTTTTTKDLSFIPRSLFLLSKTETTARTTINTFMTRFFFFFQGQGKTSVLLFWVSFARCHHGANKHL